MSVGIFFNMKPNELQHGENLLTRTCIDPIGSLYNMQLLDVCVSNHLTHAILSTLSYYVIVLPCTAVVYVLQGSDCLFSTMGEAQDVRVIVEFGYVKCFCEEG